MRHAQIERALLLLLIGCGTGAFHGVPEERRAVSMRYVNASFTRFERVADANPQATRKPRIAAAFRRGRVAVSTLRRVAADSSMRSIPLRYARSLQYDMDTIQQVIVQKAPKPSQEEAIFFAADSLELKAAYAETNKSSWATLIEVTVETRSPSGKPVPNLQIWYCPRGWAESLPHWQTFSFLSTPTTELLAPGMYLIAVGGPNNNPLPMRVGGDGRRASHYDFPVP